MMRLVPFPCQGVEHGVGDASHMGIGGPGADEEVIGGIVQPAQVEHGQFSCLEVAGGLDGGLQRGWQGG
jgi:hypothetical protein